MTRQVLIRAKARADIGAARNWYEQQRPGLGEKFLAAIAAASVKLEHDPQLHPTTTNNFAGCYCLDFHTRSSSPFRAKASL
jgi:hypothetical protein